MTNKKKVLSIVAHPDDIEIRNSGTMLLLQKKGWELHYFTISNGDLGSKTHTREEIGKIRVEESKKAAKILGAIYHHPLVGDLQIEHSEILIKKVCAIIRKVQPDIILTHPLEDYMEGHINAARLACTASFARGCVPFESIPNIPATNKPLAIYHCYPHGLRDRYNRPVTTDFYVNIEPVINIKKESIECHESQKAWLGSSQGISSLGDLVEENGLEVGKQSKVFKYAESWIKHLHLGYADENYDPLNRELKNFIHKSKQTTLNLP